MLWLCFKNISSSRTRIIFVVGLLHLKNLIINANIANLCDIVFLKNNGGSFFLLNQINIANKNVKYYFIGDSDYFNIIKNEYELECTLFSI